MDSTQGHYNRNHRHPRHRPPHNYQSRKPLLHGHNATYLKTIFLMMLLMQHAKLYGCQHQAADHIEERQSSSTGERNEKRSPLVSDSASSQPEEIFYAGNQLEMNYDEYPMVVPKRAALLLDRLMVALHRALEKEQQRLTDFYPYKTGNPNGKNAKNAISADKSPMSPPPSDIGDERIAMYSDDDPSVIMDYDFKDLSSINRATGETLMGKSFQRRANIGMDFIGGGSGGDIGTDSVIAMLTPGSDATMGGGIGAGGGTLVGSGSSSGGRHKSIGSGGGRMYWRCYFNAISCF